ncbi:collagen alpha-1(XXVIII) chain-like [Arapaima gigas]
MNSYATFINTILIRGSLIFPGEGCRQLLDSGPCRQYVVKWYYDAVANACAQFWFGGCKGNQNRFDTEDSCRKACVTNVPRLRPHELSEVSRGICTEKTANVLQECEIWLDVTAVL